MSDEQNRQPEPPEQLVKRAMTWLREDGGSHGVPELDEAQASGERHGITDAAAGRDRNPDPAANHLNPACARCYAKGYSDGFDLHRLAQQSIADGWRDGLKGAPARSERIEEIYLEAYGQAALRRAALIRTRWREDAERDHADDRSL